MERLHKLLPPVVKRNADLLQKVERFAQKAKEWSDKRDERDGERQKESNHLKKAESAVESLIVALERLLPAHKDSITLSHASRRDVERGGMVAAAVNGYKVLVQIEALGDRLTFATGGKRIIVAHEDFDRSNVRVYVYDRRKAGRPRNSFMYWLENDLRVLLDKYGITDKRTVSDTLDAVFFYADLTRPDERQFRRFTAKVNRALARLSSGADKIPSKKPA